MRVEIRQPRGDELRAAMEAAEGAFGSPLEQADWERELVSVPVDRSVAAFDDGKAVGFAAAYQFDLTVPGGPVPAAGVTWVGVLPSHRRQGILREFMQRLLEAARERDEPVAALYASEAAIYGRFGYGVAAPSVRIDADSTRVAFRDDPGRRGVVRLVDADEAYRVFPPLYERLRVERPGMLSRTEHWWRKHRLADYEHARRGASQRFYAAVELDGRVAAYALYRVKGEWNSGYAAGKVLVVEAFADGADAARELWRFLFTIDLTTRVESQLFDPASPLFLMLVDPRALHASLGDGLWLRLVDVDEALRRRAYADGGSVVVEVRDELAPWNEGRFRAGAAPGRTDAPSELRLHVADLASAYLGGYSFRRLRDAARVEEVVAGAVDRADALFRTPVAPHCPEEF